MTSFKRLTDQACWDAALIMGVAYTAIYAAMVLLIVLVDIPASNAKTVDLLAGAMTIIQATIVQFFFGSTKTGESSQRLIAMSKERTDNVMRDAVAANTSSKNIDVKDLHVNIEQEKKS